jgi:hypothetical protein
VSSDRETTRLVRSWLDEGVTTLPDRVLDAVLDELPATRQRRLAWWPARRIFDLNRTLAFSLGAAAIVIVAILGFRFLVPSGTSTGGPPSTPTPTPSPMAWPTGLGVDLAGGTYVSEGLAPIRSTITVPDGWIACGTGFDELGVCAGPGDPRGVTVSIVDNVVSDPCDRSRPLLDPPIGASVDDLVSALSNLSGFEATDPIDITLNGFAGKEFELMAPADPACALGSAGLGTWTVPGGTNGVGPGEVNLLRIVDVDGVRVMIAAAHQPVASANLIAEVRAISDSIHLIAP